MKKSFGEKFKSLFAKKDKINEEFYEDLTDILVEGDIGAKASFEIVDELEKICKQEKSSDVFRRERLGFSCGGFDFLDQNCQKELSGYPLLCPWFLYGQLCP